MLTPRENFLALLNGEKQAYFCNQYEPFDLFMGDPLMAASSGSRQMGKDTIDGWGVTIRWKEGEPSGMPHITEETKVLKDIEHWRDYVHAPDIDVPAEKWEPAKARAATIDRKEKLLTCFMATGLFEQLHFLMGFEDTLMNLLLEPNTVGELLDYILDYKLRYAKGLIENLHPDAILSHDDWGAKDRMFMSAGTWRELFKPRYEKLYGYIRSQGVLVIHHADSYCEPIVRDMVDVGINVWQGVLPSNDIPLIQKETGGKLLLMGGLDASILDVKDWSKDVIDREVARACREYAPGGAFMPCITYGTPESIFPGVFEYIYESIEKQNELYFK